MRDTEAVCRSRMLVNYFRAFFGAQRTVSRAVFHHYRENLEIKASGALAAQIVAISRSPTVLIEIEKSKEQIKRKHRTLRSFRILDIPSAK